MTDDFQLFPEFGGGESAVDADIALITAYLARELSLVQVVAVEDRLATDAAFRDKVRPIIDAWSIPTSFGSGPSQGARAWEAVPLTRAEIDAGWQRHLADATDQRTPARQPSPGRVNDGSTTRRRPSMARIAAVIAAITIPMVTVAQVVVYVARRADAPGHSVAQRIVAPFGQKGQQASAPTSETRTDASRPVPSPDDVPLVQPLPSSVSGDRSAAGAERATPSASMTRPSIAAVPPIQRATPDRARIAALATQHLPGVVRGETTADYIVVVLDASDQYVWSTHGIGDFSMEVAGDTRTPLERQAFTREYRAEYAGEARAGIGSGRARSGGAGDSVAVLYSWYPQSDSAAAAAALQARLARIAIAAGASGAGGRGGSVTTRRPGQADSVGAVAGARSGGGGRGGAVAAIGGTGARGGGGAITQGTVGGRGGSGVETGVARVGGGGRGGMVVGDFEFSASQAGEPGTYRMGFSSARYAASGMVNQAHGLQESGGGQSGIQGLLSSAVSLAELYTFPAGELAPQHLRVVVVHLTPGTDWTGR